MSELMPMAMEALIGINSAAKVQYFFELHKFYAIFFQKKTILLPESDIHNKSGNPLEFLFIMDYRLNNYK